MYKNPASDNRRGGKEVGRVGREQLAELTEEITRILERNQNERFLRKLLTRAVILEKLLQEA